MRVVADQVVRDEVLNPQHSYIVQAPAGSGKTGLITQRFLVLLAMVQEPEEIIAITFTRKAAGEMRQRIFQALQSASVDSEPAEAHDKKTWQLARTVLQQSQRCGWDLLQQPQRLMIQTIDSLCASIVRQMPLLSGFGSVPVICEDAEEFYQQAALRTIADFESRDPWSEDVCYLLTYLDNNKRRMQELLINMLGKRDQWLRHISIESDRELDRASLEEALMAEVDTHLHKLKQHLPSELEQELFRFARFAADNRGGSKPATSALLACLQGVAGFTQNLEEDYSVWRALAFLLLTGQGTWRKQVTKANGFPADKKETKLEFKDFIIQFSEHDTFRELLHAVTTLPALGYQDDDWHTLQTLFQVLRLADAHLRIVFQERGMIDFVGMSLAANHALGKVDEPSDLLLALDYRMQHILVDEYQDTSFNQYSLLEKLTAGWQPDDGRTLFLVGDPMQSIYRFREAEVGLFLQTKTQGIGSVALNSRELSVNFRSSCSVVDWVNQHFPSILAVEDDFSVGAVSYLPSIAYDQSDMEQAVFIHPFINRDDEGEAALVVDLVQRAAQENPLSTTAILVRNRSHLLSIIPALHHAGLRFRALDIESLGQRPVIRDLLAITRSLLLPADRIAWLAVLRAPWCGLSLHDMHVLANQNRYQTIPFVLQQLDSVEGLSTDGRRRLGQIVDLLLMAQRERMRISLRRAVEGLWLALGGPATVAQQKDLEDTEVFFYLLEQMEEARALDDVAVFEEKVGRLFSSPDVGAGDALQIMTLHKSKGLEFDTVIIPGLGRPPRSSESRLLYWMERPADDVTGSHLLMGPMERFARRDKDTIKEYIKALEGEKMQHEFARFVYVAVTRAKYRVHLLGHIKASNKDGDRVLSAPPKASLLATLWPVLEQDYIAALDQQIAWPLVNEDIMERPLCSISRHAEGWVLPEPLPGLSIHKQQDLEVDNVAVEFSWASENARISGTVIHRLLQDFVINEGGLIQQDKIKQYNSIARVLLAREGMPSLYLDNAVERVVGALVKTLTSTRGRWMFSDKHRDIHAEYALVSLLQDRPARLVIDRTFIDEQGVRWIIDYKTGSHVGHDVDVFIEREKERYQAQLNRYARAMAVLGDEEIMLALYFPVMDEWVEWDWGALV